jgi:hypothetical protein
LVALLFAVFESTSPCGTATVAVLTIVWSVVFVSGETVDRDLQRARSRERRNRHPGVQLVKRESGRAHCTAVSVMQLTVACGGTVLKLGTAGSATTARRPTTRWSC